MSPILLKDGTVKDHADLARLGGVSRARITQIMNLRLLTPDIQEQLLFHERAHGPKDTVRLRDLQKVSLEADWDKQHLRYSSMGTRNNTIVRFGLANYLPVFSFFEWCHSWFILSDILGNPSGVKDLLELDLGQQMANDIRFYFSGRKHPPISLPWLRQTTDGMSLSWRRAPIRGTGLPNNYSRDIVVASQKVSGKA